MERKHTLETWHPGNVLFYDSNPALSSITMFHNINNPLPYLAPAALLPGNLPSRAKQRLTAILHVLRTSPPSALSFPTPPDSKGL